MTRIVALVPDLMDRSRFGPFADDTVFVKTAADVLSAASAEGVEIVVIDLSRDGAAQLLPRLEGRKVLTFSSHVNRDAMMAASMSSSAEVMARSVFFNRLPQLLSR